MGSKPFKEGWISTSSLYQWCLVRGFEFWFYRNVPSFGLQINAIIYSATRQSLSFLKAKAQRRNDLFITCIVLMAWLQPLWLVVLLSYYCMNVEQRSRSIDKRIDFWFHWTVVIMVLEIFLNPYSFIIHYNLGYYRTLTINDYCEDFIRGEAV